jgi:hypothetical protein
MDWFSNRSWNKRSLSFDELDGRNCPMTCLVRKLTISPKEKSRQSRPNREYNRPLLLAIDRPKAIGNWAKSGKKTS